MDKKTYNPNSEEEYHFQEPEVVSSEYSDKNDGGKKTSTIFERTKRQHIFLVLVVIFAILGVYKLVDKFFITDLGDKSKLIEKSQKPLDQKLSDTKKNATQIAEDNVNHHFSQLEQEQQNLQSDLKSLSSQVESMGSTLSDLDIRLTQLSDQTQTLELQQVAFIKKQEQSEKKVVTKKKEEPKPIYYVRAIIPGRAWLTSIQDDGLKSTLTVRIGSKLYGYGVVKAIDPDQGTITLSSGAVIGYSPNDR